MTEFANQNPESMEAARQMQFKELGIEDSPEARIAQLRGITAEGIADISAKIHTIVAPDVSHMPHRKVMHVQGPDGSDRRELMQPSDRQLHLEHAAELVRQLSSLETSNADENGLLLRRAGNVLALAVVQAHTFEDGNGRTARTLAQLVREGVGVQKSEAYADLLTVGKNRPETGFRMNSFMPTDQGLTMRPEQVLDLAAALDIPLNNPAAYREQQNKTFSVPYDD